MNIVVISNSAAPSKNASSLQVSKLCEAFSFLNHKVTLILPNTGNGENYFKFYDIKSKFKIIRLKLFSKFPTGIKYYLFSLIAIFKGLFLSTDLFVTRNYFAAFILSFFKNKVILEIHDTLEIEGRLVKILQKNLNFLNYDAIIKIIVTTKSLKSYFTEHWSVEEEKIQVLHNGTSLKSFFKKRNNKKIQIGYFGSIYKSRGIEMILKLCKIDKRNNYIIYGGTKEDVKKIKSSYFGKNLYINDHIPYNEIFKKLRDIDVCILPYTKKITVSGNVGDISKYTSPLKIFDYMINGKLIICSDLPVLREVLKNNFNSILVKNFNKVERWLKIINNISKNFERYNQIRYNALIFAKKENMLWRAKKILANC